MYSRTSRGPSLGGNEETGWLGPDLSMGTMSEITMEIEGLVGTLTKEGDDDALQRTSTLNPPLSPMAFPGDRAKVAFGLAEFGSRKNSARGENSIEERRASSRTSSFEKLSQRDSRLSVPPSSGGRRGRSSERVSWHGPLVSPEAPLPPLPIAKLRSSFTAPHTAAPDAAQRYFDLSLYFGIHEQLMEAGGQNEVVAQLSFVENVFHDAAASGVELNDPAVLSADHLFFSLDPDFVRSLMADTEFLSSLGWDSENSLPSGQKFFAFCFERAFRQEVFEEEQEEPQGLYSHDFREALNLVRETLRDQGDDEETKAALMENFGYLAEIALKQKTWQTKVRMFAGQKFRQAVQAREAMEEAARAAGAASGEVSVQRVKGGQTVIDLSALSKAVAALEPAGAASRQTSASSSVQKRASSHPTVLASGSSPRTSLRQAGESPAKRVSLRGRSPGRSPPAARLSSSPRSSAVLGRGLPTRADLVSTRLAERTAEVNAALDRSPSPRNALSARSGSAPSSPKGYRAPPELSNLSALVASMNRDTDRLMRGSPQQRSPARSGSPARRLSARSPTGTMTTLTIGDTTPGGAGADPGVTAATLRSMNPGFPLTTAKSYPPTRLESPIWTMARDDPEAPANLGYFKPSPPASRRNSEEDYLMEKTGSGSALKHLQLAAGPTKEQKLHNRLQNTAQTVISNLPVFDGTGQLVRRNSITAQTGAGQQNSIQRDAGESAGRGIQRASSGPRARASSEHRLSLAFQSSDDEWTSSEDESENDSDREGGDAAPIANLSLVPRGAGNRKALSRTQRELLIKEQLIKAYSEYECGMMNRCLSRLKTKHKVLVDVEHAEALRLLTKLQKEQFVRQKLKVHQEALRRKVEIIGRAKVEASEALEGRQEQDRPPRSSEGSDLGRVNSGDRREQGDRRGTTLAGGALDLTSQLSAFSEESEERRRSSAGVGGTTPPAHHAATISRQKSPLTGEKKRRTDTGFSTTEYGPIMHPGLRRDTHLTRISTASDVTEFHNVPTAAKRLPKTVSMATNEATRRDSNPEEASSSWWFAPTSDGGAPTESDAALRQKKEIARFERMVSETMNSCNTDLIVTRINNLVIQTSVIGARFESSEVYYEPTFTDWFFTKQTAEESIYGSAAAVSGGTTTGDGAAPAGAAATYNLAELDIFALKNYPNIKEELRTQEDWSFPLFSASGNPKDEWCAETPLPIRWQSTQLAGSLTNFPPIKRHELVSKEESKEERSSAKYLTTSELDNICAEMFNTILLYCGDVPVLPGEAEKAFLDLLEDLEKITPLVDEFWLLLMKQATANPDIYGSEEFCWALMKRVVGHKFVESSSEGSGGKKGKEELLADRATAMTQAEMARMGGASAASFGGRSSLIEDTDVLIFDETGEYDGSKPPPLVRRLLPSKRLAIFVVAWLRRQIFFGYRAKEARELLRLLRWAMKLDEKARAERAAWEKDWRNHVSLAAAVGGLEGISAGGIDVARLGSPAGRGDSGKAGISRGALVARGGVFDPAKKKSGKEQESVGKEQDKLLALIRSVAERQDAQKLGFLEIKKHMVDTKEQQREQRRKSEEKRSSSPQREDQSLAREDLSSGEYLILPELKEWTRKGKPKSIYPKLRISPNPFHNARLWWRRDQTDKEQLAEYRRLEGRLDERNKKQQAALDKRMFAIGGEDEDAEKNGAEGGMETTSSSSSADDGEGEQPPAQTLQQLASRSNYSSRQSVFIKSYDLKNSRLLRGRKQRERQEAAVPAGGLWGSMLGTLGVGTINEDEEYVEEDADQVGVARLTRMRSTWRKMRIRDEEYVEEDADQVGVARLTRMRSTWRKMRIR